MSRTTPAPMDARQVWADLSRGMRAEAHQHKLERIRAGFISRVEYPLASAFIIAWDAGWMERVPLRAPPGAWTGDMSFYAACGLHRTK